MSDVQTKDKELFDSIAKQYSEKDVVLSCREAREYQLHAGVGPLHDTLGRVLEIGCGVGASASYLKGKFSEYIGIDYSVEQIKYARQAHEGVAHVTFEVCNVKEMQYANIQPVDTVLAVGAFHHFTELDKVFTSIQSVLKDGGHLIAVEPQRNNPVVQLLRFIRTKVDSNYSSDQVYFTADELGDLLRTHGFSDVVVEYEGFFSPPFAQVVLYPQWIFLPLSRLSIKLDALCDKYLPLFLKKMSWNIVVRGTYVRK